MKKAIYLSLIVIFVAAGCNPSPVNTAVPSAISPTLHPVTPTPQIKPTPTLAEEEISHYTQALFQSDDLVVYTYHSENKTNPEQVNLCLWREELGTALLKAEIEKNGFVTDAIASPNQDLIVYVLFDSRDQLPELWAAGVDGKEDYLLLGKEDLYKLRGAYSRAVPFQMVWVPGTNRLLFNSTEMSYAGGLLDDLHMYDFDNSVLTTVLPPGSGGRIKLSPDGKYAAIIAPASLKMIDLETMEVADILQYDPVATYTSNQAFYPAPRWLPDSSGFVLTVPSPLPLQEEASLFVYRVSIMEGTAEKIAVFDSGPRFAQKVFYSPDLSWVAYQTIINEDHTAREIHLGNLETGAKMVYQSNNPEGGIAFRFWLEDSLSFVFKDGDGKTYLGNLFGDRQSYTPPKQPAEESLPWIDLNCADGSK